MSAMIVRLTQHLGRHVRPQLREISRPLRVVFLKYPANSVVSEELHVGADDFDVGNCNGDALRVSETDGQRANRESITTLQGVM